MKNYVDKDKLHEYTTKLTNKYKSVFATKAEVGSPLKASTVAEMTDESRIYVYTGSESGYTSGNWYYYNGSAWTSGGVYNSTAFETDATLAVPGMAADAKATGDEIGKNKENITNLNTAVTDITGNLVVNGWSEYTNKCIDLTVSQLTIESGVIVPTTISSGTHVRYLTITVNPGDIYTITATGIGNKARTYGFATEDGTVIFRAGYTAPNPTVLNKSKITVPTNAKYLIVNDAIGNGIVYSGDLLINAIDLLEKKTKNVDIPILRNGSAGNSGNENSVSTEYIMPIDFSKDSVIVEYLGDSALADEYYFAYCLFRGNDVIDGMTSVAAYSAAGPTNRKTYNASLGNPVNTSICEFVTADFAGYNYIMFFLFRKKNDEFVPLRIATDQYSLSITYGTQSGLSTNREIDNTNTLHNLLNAKHSPGEGTKLTLLHFSDLHKDTGALARIIKDSESFVYDDAICTGDMVENTYEQIESWWDSPILTCIGNHDTAETYIGEDGKTHYNWTALSMANRSAYYIEPFKSGWGIVHTNGKSYYYKDYSEAKVRLIVMDIMLYANSNTEENEPTNQNSWLSNLLTDAISNNLHVLIAIHAPHGGAVAKDCSFSKYYKENDPDKIMPTKLDCNTPQAVIDAVNEKITNGLKFIGYIVGHTHQDNIWDAENDNKQLMYCITCASTDTLQWETYGDMFRSAENDAYNIIVIDTANTLVKIIRGGGANIDNHMRTRKSICFDYSSGTKVGEVL